MIASETKASGDSPRQKRVYFWLVLVVFVRNRGSDAYRQIHRVNPVSIDFKAGGPERIRQDRRQMLLHHSEDA